MDVLYDLSCHEKSVVIMESKVRLALLFLFVWLARTPKLPLRSRILSEAVLEMMWFGSHTHVTNGNLLVALLILGFL